MLEEKLKSFGLTKQEVKTYLACLELGPASILDISRKTRQSRSQVYPVIETLLEKKLLSMTAKGKRKLFVAESPTMIKSLLQEKLSQFDLILPDLIALNRTGTIKPVMRFYEGLEGIKEIYRASAHAKEGFLYAITGVESLNMRSKALWHFWLTEFTILRKRNKVMSKLVMPDTLGGKTYKASDKEKFRETRLVPASIYNFPGEILVYDDVTCLFVFSDKEEFAVSVKSTAIAETIKMIWRIVWQQGY